jgi:hypothetical protein
MTEQWADDVKRVKDAMDLHAIGGANGQYAVFSLQTGTPVVMDTFPSRRDARRIASMRTTDALLILQVAPDGMPYNEAAACLKYERALWSAGVRTPDSMEDEQNSGLLSIPRTKQDRRRMAKQLISGLPEMQNGQPYGNLPYYLRKGL